MNSNVILKKVFNYLNQSEVANLIDVDENYQLNESLCSMLEILNSVVRKIATEFVYCIKEEEIVCNNGKFKLSDLSEKFLFVRSLKNSIGLNVSYAENSGFLLTKSGVYNLRYCYLPKNVSFNCEIQDFPSFMIEEDVVLGILAEYFLKLGYYEEYEIYESKFVEKLQKCSNKLSEMKVKRRLWL